MGAGKEVVSSGSEEEATPSPPSLQGPGYKISVGSRGAAGRSWAPLCSQVVQCSRQQPGGAPCNLGNGAALNQSGEQKSFLFISKEMEKLDSLMFRNAHFMGGRPGLGRVGAFQYGVEGPAAACVRSALSSQTSQRHPSPDHPRRTHLPGLQCRWSPGPTQVGSPLGARLTAELPTPPAQLAAETPQPGLSSHSRPPLPRRLRRQTSRGQALLRRDCVSKTRKASSWVSSDSVLVLRCCCNETRVCQNRDKHCVERTVFR